VTWPWLVGPTRQRGKERTEGTDSVSFLGCGLLLHTGPKGSPGPFLFFSFLFFLFFFCFLISFVTFAFVIQIDSN
jgi:hypothetical protein